VKTAALVSRILLGLVFTLAGASGFFFLVVGAPPQPGLAGAFQDVFFRSHWVAFVDGVELVAGVLLLCKQFVPLALVALAAVIANIYAFHITMQPLGLPAPIVVTALWVIVAWRYRPHLLPLLARDARVAQTDAAPQSLLVRANG
jgi:uncharacterized membrane protein YphA (DoxX/SURF4 family)